jgi:hypothetical protein
MDLVTRTPHGSCEKAGGWEDHRLLWVKPLLWGLVSAGLQVGFYLGVVTLAQDWAHARDQIGVDRWFVFAVSSGFGIQVGLFVYLRSLHARSSAGAMVASTGTSTVAMLACCAHHFADTLPLIGLSGAAVFLDDFKAPILWTGLAMNGLGVAYLGRKIRQRRSHIVRLEMSLQEGRAAPGMQQSSETPAAAPAGVRPGRTGTVLTRPLRQDVHQNPTQETLAPLQGVVVSRHDRSPGGQS